MDSEITFLWTPSYVLAKELYESYELRLRLKDYFFLHIFEVTKIRRHKSYRIFKILAPENPLIYSINSAALTL